MPRHPRFYITKKDEQHYLWRAKFDSEFRESKLFKRVKLIRWIQIASTAFIVIGFVLVLVLGEAFG